MENDVKSVFLEATHGSGNIDHLFGPHAAAVRQKLMSMMAGTTIPKAKCGYNACRQALLDLFKISGGGCKAGDDRLLMEHVTRS